MNAPVAAGHERPTSMRFGSRSNGHPSRETLHATAAGEVDPLQRASVLAHIKGCRDCTSAYRQVEGMLSQFRAMEPPPVDDLSWARMSRRIMTELETRASAPPPAPLWAARIFPAAVMTAMAVALVVWFTPRPVPAPASVAHLPNPAITAGAEPFEFTLQSGVSLRLGEHAQIRLQSAGERLRIDLVNGELAVTQPREAAALEFRTPELTALAQGASFTVSYLGQESTIRVERGRVELLGDVSPGVISAGERRTIKRGVVRAAAVEPSPAQLSASEPLRSLAPSPTLPRPKASAEPSIAPLAHASVEGQTEVVMEAPAAEDPVAERWRSAVQAFDSGEAETAIRLANDVVLLGRGRPEERDALDLLCTAELTLGAADKAVVACEALIGVEAGAEPRRLLHHRVANIYRVKLHDCAHALPHYDQTIVFGGTSLVDDEALLGRAECALELGKLDVAARDLRAVGARSERLVRKSTYDTLLMRLDAARKNEGAGKP